MKKKKNKQAGLDEAKRVPIRFSCDAFILLLIIIWLKNAFGSQSFIEVLLIS